MGFPRLLNLELLIYKMVMIAPEQAPPNGGGVTIMLLNMNVGSAVHPVKNVQPN